MYQVSHIEKNVTLAVRRFLEAKICRHPKQNFVIIFFFSKGSCLPGKFQMSGTSEVQALLG